MNPRVPMGHTSVRRSCRTAVIHSTVLSTAEMRRRRTLQGEKGPPPGAMASDVEFDVVLVDGGNLRLQGRRRRWWSFWRSWQKWVSPAERNWRPRG
jgi:hypothetical protein